MLDNNWVDCWTYTNCDIRFSPYLADHMNPNGPDEFPGLPAAASVLPTPTD